MLLYVYIVCWMYLILFCVLCWLCVQESKQEVSYPWKPFIVSVALKPLGFLLLFFFFMFQSSILWCFWSMVLIKFAMQVQNWLLLERIMIWKINEKTQNLSFTLPFRCIFWGKLLLFCPSIFWTTYLGQDCPWGRGNPRGISMRNIQSIFSQETHTIHILETLTSINVCLDCWGKSHEMGRNFTHTKQQQGSNSGGEQ